MDAAKQQLKDTIKKWTNWIKDAEARGDESSAMNYRLYREGLLTALNILEDCDGNERTVRKG